VLAYKHLPSLFDNDCRGYQARLVTFPLSLVCLCKLQSLTYEEVECDNGDDIADTLYRTWQLTPHIIHWLKQQSSDSTEVGVVLRETGEKEPSEIVLHSNRVGTKGGLAIMF
jgi:hypothetical protein